MNKITITLLLAITISGTVCVDFLGRDVDNFISNFLSKNSNTTVDEAFIICGIERRREENVRVENPLGVALALHPNSKFLSLYDNQGEISANQVHEVCYPVLQNTKILELVRFGKYIERVGINFAKKIPGLIVQAVFITNEGQSRFGTMIGISQNINGAIHYIVVGFAFDAHRFSEDDKLQLIENLREVIPDLVVV